MTGSDEFDRLVADAEVAPIGGWDFSWLDGRLIDEPTSWSYWSEVSTKSAAAHTLLDIGTGGGERLAKLLPRSGATIATESYTPNVSVAKQQLHARGVSVVFADEEIHNQ